MDLLEKYIASAYRYLGRRPRSEKEVRDNLLKKKAPLEVIETIISSLKTQRFLNDTEFARWWVRQRRLFRQRGIPLLRMELQQKGIAKDIIEQVIAEPVDDQIITELDQAKLLVEKRIKRYRDLPREELYQKLGGFLARRGFNWDTIKRAIDQAVKTE